LPDHIDIYALTGTEAQEQCGALAEVLIACVHGGASVSFMAPLDREKAESFWRGVADSVVRGERILVVAKERDGRVVGTAQVVLNVPENQPHRGDVAKMLVHPEARRRGIAARMLRFAEGQARAAGKTLLVLDTVTGGDAERLYEREGWARVGVIPDYALFPDGRFCDTTVFYKRL
jgi:GNAT superfamily N-acetyltransferase